VADTPQNPGPSDKGVADILTEAWRLYRKHARALLLTCAVVFVPASFLKSCALSAIMAPGSAAAAAVQAAQAVPEGDLDAANRNVQDAYQRHADKATLARLEAERDRVREDVRRRHELAAGQAMGGFILFVLGIFGSLVTFFAYAVTVPMVQGALTIASADLAAGRELVWRDVWAAFFNRLGPLLTAVVPAAFITAFAFACFSAVGFASLGLIAALLFAFVAPVVLLENLRGRAAIRRSVDLVMADWLRVALMVIAFALIRWIGDAVAGLLVPLWAPFVSSFLGDLLMFVLLPLPVLGLVLLYVDIRRKRENYTEERLGADVAALKSA
jgi:hypothetical protein